MHYADYAKYDGLGLAELVRRKEVQPAELVETAIARAETVNPSLNFMVFSDFERARADAKRGAATGPFAGVPMFLKDILAFAEGMPTRQGSRFIPAIASKQDSVLTARFRAAGLLPLGKTNVPEFGMVPTTESKLYGPASNPFDLAHSTGGSSGGSAAAVAAGVVPIAHANDGGGSIRIPASCCGLVGLKPTRGRVTVAPELGDAVDGLAIDHVVTRSVRDCAAALDAIGGNVPGDPYWAPPAPPSWLAAMRETPRRLRIAFSSRRLDGSAMHPDCVSAVQQAAKLCGELGHAVAESGQQFDLSVLVPSFMTMWSANLAAAVDAVAKATGQTPVPELFEGLTWGMYETGRRVGASDYLVAKDTLQRASRGAAQFHDVHDLWLTPTLGTPPMKNGVFDVEERDIYKGFLPLFEYVPFTAFQNVTGQPAMNVPLFWNSGGLPIGVQFVAPFGDETTLFQLARQLEEAAPWSDRYAQVKI
ncbi:MAG TPA: amidase family protein [Rhizomicrobium sp.]|jgi:amidase|nr:amidase family protein [Rhizomicrobium sp.]